MQSYVGCILKCVIVLELLYIYIGYTALLVHVGDLVVNLGIDDPHPSAGVTDQEPELSSNAPNLKKAKALAKPLSDATNTGAGVASYLQVVLVSLILEPVQRDCGTRSREEKQ